MFLFGSVMYVQASLTAEASVFLDPNLLSEDGTTCLYGSSFSDDGLFFTYGLSKAGSDWITIQVVIILKTSEFNYLKHVKL